MKKLYKNFSSRKDTVEAMACYCEGNCQCPTLCPCPNAMNYAAMDQTYISEGVYNNNASFITTNNTNNS